MCCAHAWCCVIASAFLENWEQAVVLFEAAVLRREQTDGLGFSNVHFQVVLPQCGCAMIPDVTRTSLLL